MARKAYHLPRKIVLPFDYSVKVKLATPTQCRTTDASQGEVYGWWDPDTKTIYIRKTLKPAQKRYILAHEMQHAILDWMHEKLDSGVMGATKA